MLIRLLLLAVYLVQIISTACPVEDDPTNLARCIQVDTSAIVGLAKGSNDMTSFCALADRYMECIKTYTRGCVGFFFGEGFLTEVQNIALYCCNGIESTRDCPLNPNIQRRCIDGEASAILSDGLTEKRLRELEIGDKVKTIDSDGRLVDTDVIMILDTSNETALFLRIKTSSNKEIKLSAAHLVAQQSGERFKQARELSRGESLTIYENGEVREDRIESIEIEWVQSYTAPLTWHGTLLVNGVLASSYAHIRSHRLAHFAMLPVRIWWRLFNNNNHFSFNIEKQQNGTHWFPKLLEKFTESYLMRNVLILD